MRSPDYLSKLPTTTVEQVTQNLTPKENGILEIIKRLDILIDKQDETNRILREMNKKIVS